MALGILTSKDAIEASFEGHSASGNMACKHEDGDWLKA
jgi:hypothetical protein